MIDVTTTILSTGQTEVGTVEVQPARDNQLGATDYRWPGRFALPAQPFRLQW